jgi:hypothetical protein
MNYFGVDLHKHSISVCVVVQDSASRRVARRKRLACQDEERIYEHFAQLRPKIVVDRRRPFRDNRVRATSARGL